MAALTQQKLTFAIVVVEDDPKRFAFHAVFLTLLQGQSFATNVGKGGRLRLLVHPLAWAQLLCGAYPLLELLLHQVKVQRWDHSRLALSVRGPAAALVVVAVSVPHSVPLVASA